MKTALLFIAMLVAFTTTGVSQDNEDFGYFNDIQVSTAVNKQVDVIGGLRFNSKRNANAFAEQRLYTGLNWRSKDGKFTIQPWVVLIRNFAKVSYVEVRPQVTFGYKFTTKNKVNITPRVRLEYHARFKSKDAGRVVPILTFDKKLSKKYGVFQTTELWIPVNM